MISKITEKALLNAVVGIITDAGHQVREYGISHLVQSRVGDDGKGNEFVISLRYDESNGTSEAKCEEKG